MSKTGGVRKNFGPPRDLSLDNIRGILISCDQALMAFIHSAKTLFPFLYMLASATQIAILSPSNLSKHGSS